MARRNMPKLLTLLLTASLLAAAPVLAGERCGPRTCDDGDTCCNESCGICVPPNGACILPYCGWDRTGFQGHRPLVPFGWATPFAASSAAVQLGTRSDEDEYVTHVVDGRAQGTLALSRSWFLRADAELERGWLDEERLSAEAKATAPTRDVRGFFLSGYRNVQVDAAWTVPVRLTWLQLALMLGTRHQSVRYETLSFTHLDAPRSVKWHDNAGWYLVPGAAVSAGDGWLALSGMAQALLPVGDPDPSLSEHFLTMCYEDEGLRVGAGLSVDLMRFDVPIQAMLAVARLSTGDLGDPNDFGRQRTTATAGVSLSLRPWRMVLEAGQVTTTTEHWEGEEQTLAVRFEWLPQP